MHVSQGTLLLLLPESNLLSDIAFDPCIHTHSHTYTHRGMLALVIDGLEGLTADTILSINANDIIERAKIRWGPFQIFT
jgi:hypothetical protein